MLGENESSYIDRELKKYYNAAKKDDIEKEESKDENESIKSIVIARDRTNLFKYTTPLKHERLDQ